MIWPEFPFESEAMQYLPRVQVSKVLAVVSFCNDLPPGEFFL